MKGTVSTHPKVSTSSMKDLMALYMPKPTPAVRTTIGVNLKLSEAA